MILMKMYLDGKMKDEQQRLENSAKNLENDQIGVTK